MLWLTFSSNIGDNMSIKLFEHNQTAYESVIKMLAETSNNYQPDNVRFFTYGKTDVDFG